MCALSEVARHFLVRPAGLVRRVGRILLKRMVGWKIGLALGLLFVGGLGGARLALWFVPLPEALFAAQIPQFEILDRNGHSLRAAHPDGGPFSQRAFYGE